MGPRTCKVEGGGVECARSRLLCLGAKDSSWLDLSNRRVSASRDTCLQAL